MRERGGGGGEREKEGGRSRNTNKGRGACIPVTYHVNMHQIWGVNPKGFHASPKGSSR